MHKSLRFLRNKRTLSTRRRRQSRRHRMNTRRRQQSKINKRNFRSVRGGGALYGLTPQTLLPTADISDPSIQPVGQLHGAHNPYLV
jgi:hypothetical protein